MRKGTRAAAEKAKSKLRRTIGSGTLAIGLACAALLGAASCASSPSGGEGKEAELERRARRMENLRAALGTEWGAPAELDFYRDFYRMPTDSVSAAVRRLDRDGRGLFALRLTPSEVRGRALVVHGYMSHSGQFSDLARTLVGAGYEVWMLDLPGFGLSDGARNGIDDFHSYGNAVGEIARAMAAENAPQRAAGAVGGKTLPTVAVGHSTGCSAITDFILRYPEDAALLDRFILVAPLVRTTGWTLKRLATKITGEKPFTFPRLHLAPKGTIANPAFQDFILDEDPLFFPIYDASWIQAADRWNEFIGPGTDSGWKGRALLLQGTIDDVVDYQYNIPVLARVFPGLETRLLDGYSHTILSEAPDRLEPVLRDIADYLSR